MTCPYCASNATTERPDRTELGYRRFRCRDCKRVFNERTRTLFNRLQYPTDIANLANISFTPVRNEADCIRWAPSRCSVGTRRKL
jgi:transposase-like protein